MALPRTQIGAVSFGRYRLGERLGAGGMAVVYHATVDGPAGFQRSLVIKRMHPEFARDPAFLKMLIAEARLSALLHHPNIVQVHELGEVDGEHFLAMEYVDGWDLSTVLKHATRTGQPIPPALACHIVCEVAGALAYAHGLADEQGQPLEIVHRDISPSNVMLTRQGRCKLLDFGIAKAASCVRDEQTRTGTLKGKLSYMSPEQADGRPIDKRTDVFALGIVFHELLVGRRLFRGSDDLHTLRLVREAEVTPPSVLRDGLTPDIDRVVLRMLARDLESRFASCEEVVAALSPLVHRLHGDPAAVRRYLDELGPVQTRSSPTPTFPPPGSEAPQRNVTLTQSSGELVEPVIGSPKIRSRRARIVSIALGATLLGLAGAAWLPRPAQPSAPPPIVASAAPIAVLPPAKQPPPELPPPPPATEESAASPTPHTAPQLERRVHLRVRGAHGVDVLVDGVTVGSTPLDLALPARESTRQVVLRGARTSAKHTIRGDADVVLEMSSAPTRPKKPKHGGGSSEIKDPFAN
jgi:serine/threonine-protein kinase